MPEWKYGDSWEKYPIEPGEVWMHKPSCSMISIADIREGVPVYMMQADMVYADPPWNKGNANAFITKAGMDSYIKDYAEFETALFEVIKSINAKVCYLEMGKERLGEIMNLMHQQYPNVQVWQITYYKKHSCYLVRGGHDECSFNYTGMDDEKTPYAAINYECPSCVADMCTGRGLTLLAAHKHGVTFLGTELNKRRLAVAIDRAAKEGIIYEKYNF